MSDVHLGSYDCPSSLPLAGSFLPLILVFMQPRRDGAMENDIVVHEMTHGITNRMTGGGTGRCLQTLEAGGLGEGWSDAMAEYVVLSFFMSTWSI